MEQLKILPLVALISGAMVGCGGGEGGGGGKTPPLTYTWQMVNLYATDRSDVGNGCVIYDEQEGQPGKVITAQVANTGFKVLYHNADGSIITEKTIDRISPSGKVTIEPGKLPEDGYVSVEELDGTIGGTHDVYMFSVQKDFLRNMVVNVRQKQSSSNPCFNGEQNKTEVSDNAVITVAQNSASTRYYQSSFVDAEVDGNEVASNIPVRAPLETNEKVLITAFDSYSSNQYHNLKYFVFADGSAIYDVNNPPSSVHTIFMQPVDRSDVNVYLSGVDINDDSAVMVAFNNEIYQWQPIYSSTNPLSYTDSNLNVNGWSVELGGSTPTGNWKYHSLTSYVGSDINIDAPVVSDFDESFISSSCNEASYCLSGVGFTSSDFDIQRTHLRSTTNNGSRNFYQTIFAKPDNNQVLMESSEETLVPNSDSDHLEVSIASLDRNNNAAVMYFIENNADIQSVVTALVPSFSDVNGSLSTASQIKNRRLKLMSQNVTILENSKN